jgi:hypothetical protein
MFQLLGVCTYLVIKGNLLSFGSVCYICIQKTLIAFEKLYLFTPVFGLYFRSLSAKINTSS